MTVDAKTSEFLDLYNRLENAIRESYPIPADQGPVAWLARNERGFRSIRNELDYCREIRNFLQHNERVNDEYAVIPSEGMLESLRETLSKVVNMPKAGSLCVKTQDIYSVCMDDRIRPAMRAMAENVFTHVPILEGGRVKGVFSENTLLSYMNSDEIVEIAEDDTFERVRDLLPLDKHVSETFAFVGRDMTATSLAELFQDALKRHERLGMVFVTASGSQSEKLLGILTSWDMAAFF